MDAELESLSQEHLDGALNEAGQRRLAELLDRDPEALGEVADQLQIHHRLREALREEAPSLAEPVLREIRFQGDSPRFSQEVVQRLKGESPRGARWGRWGMAAACLAIAAAGLFHFARPRGETPAAPSAGEILFVVGRLPLTPADDLVKERLERLRLTVTPIRNMDVTAASAKGRILVLISSTSIVKDTLDFSPQVAKIFRELSAPVITLEPMFLPLLGMTLGEAHKTDWAAAKDQTHLLLTHPEHPLAAGRSGRVRAASAPSQFSWGRPGDQAIRIATIEGQPSQAAIFAYDRGARMPGGAAPARRVGLFPFQTAVASLTEEGWALFDAAVHWCTER